MIDHDVIPDGYQLVRRSVDKLVAGDVVSWTRDVYFYTVTWVYPHDNYNKGPTIMFDVERKFPNGNTLSTRSDVKPSTRIWVLDKVDAAG